MAESRAWGHLIYYDEESNKWLYQDDNSLFDIQNPRKCVKCDQLPSEKGHDACITDLPNVKFACCGHGIQLGYIHTELDEVIRFEPNCVEMIIEFAYNNFK